MMSSRTPWRKILFFIGLSVGLWLFGRQLWISFRALQIGQLRLENPSHLLLAFALTVCVYALQIIAWTALMRYLGVLLGLRQAFAGLVLTFLPRYIPGSVWGYVSRGAWLEQAFGINYAVSGLGSVLEAGFLVFTGLCMAGLGLGSFAGGIFRWAAPAAELVALMLVWLVLPNLLRWGSRKFSPMQGINPASLQPPYLLAALVSYLLLWGAFAGAVYFTASALGSLPSSFMACVLAASQSWVIGFLAVIVPAGIGVREAGLVTLLIRYGHLSSEHAVSLAVLSRFQMLLAELLWLAAGLLPPAIRRTGGREARKTNK